MVGSANPPRLGIGALIAASALLSALSLLLPFAPVYDPWAWLVWGREVVDLDLATASGPSWKPLPVIVDSALAPSGAAAPELWLLVARTGWLVGAGLTAVLAWRLVFPPRLATRLALRFAPRRVRQGRMLAAALALLGFVLLHDVFSSWTRQFAGGTSEPLLVALVLAAVERHLQRRPGQAVALAFAASLLRPEAWPFLLLYGVYVWRRAEVSRTALVAVAVAVPVLWLIPDLLASGSALTGAERARGDSGFLPLEAVEAIGRSLNLALAGLWAGAAYALFTARRNGETAIVVLGAGALAWIAIVALLAAGGFAGIPRFSAPAAAVGCVLGGVGVVRMIAATDGLRVVDPRRRAALAATGLVVAVLVLQALVRTADVAGDVDTALDYGDNISELSELVDEIGAERITGCGVVATGEFDSSTALAWQLELPLARVDTYYDAAPTAGTAFVGPETTPASRSAIERRGDELGSYGRWSGYAISCAAPDSEISARASSVGVKAIAGVRGGLRYGDSSTSSSSR